MPAARLTFLPWTRQGAAGAIREADTLTAAHRGAAQLAVTLAVNDSPLAPVAVRLRGPADVTGVDAAQIVRRDPPPASRDFEPNYFACIEFARADFPWLLTPLRADAQARLRPWLVLVVVQQREGVTLKAPVDGPLPVLEIAPPAQPIVELPDLRESWAWAHAQAAADAQAGSVRAALDGADALALSRLLCPRLLEPDTDYLACVVPAFDLGRRAGLGTPPAERDVDAASALAPAWDHAQPPSRVQLPVYHHWTFRTGSGGDFESLVRKLTPRDAPAGLGRTIVSIGQPGFALPQEFPAGATLELRGALQPLTEPDAPPPWPAGSEAEFKTALSEIVNAPGRDETFGPAVDPLLAPPLYGRWHAARATVSPAAAQPVPWLDDLNLDPRDRVVASLGTQVVQQHQEALMAAAWEQAGALQQANQRVRALQLALAAATSLHARHFMRLDDGTALRMAAPAFGRLRVAAADGSGLRSVAIELQGKSIPTRATAAPLQRIARERGPLARRIVRQGVARRADTGGLRIGTIARFEVSATAVVVRPTPDFATVQAIGAAVPRAAVRPSTQVTEQRVGNMFGRPAFRVVAPGAPVPVPPMVDFAQAADSPTARDFRNAAREHLARVAPDRGFRTQTLPTIDLHLLARSVVGAMHPRQGFVALTRALVATGAGAAPPTGTATAAAAGIDIVMAAPKFTQPMFEPLRELAADLLLPGLGKVDPDTVLGLKTNRRFVESYLVGLNVEMGRELLWRGYPTDQRSTCFAQFWDTRAAPQPRADIEPIHLWGERALGSAAGAPARERFVMLLRSALLQRYPNAAIFAVRARRVDGVRQPGSEPGDELPPAFRGSFPPDVTFFGFDIDEAEATGADGGEGWYVVIQEHPTEPRFGLDVGTAVAAGSHLAVAAGPPPGLPPGPLQWGRNAAHLAGLLRQLPVRVAIHASRLLPAHN